MRASRRGVADAQDREHDANRFASALSDAAEAFLAALRRTAVLRHPPKPHGSFQGISHRHCYSVDRLLYGTRRRRVLQESTHQVVTRQQGFRAAHHGREAVDRGRLFLWQNSPAKTDTRGCVMLVGIGIQKGCDDSRRDTQPDEV